MNKVNTIQIPVERYGYFSNELRAGERSRLEMMRHLEILIQEEILRHKKAWDELVQLAGFADVGALKKAGKDATIDWDKCCIKITDIKP